VPFYVTSANAHPDGSALGEAGLKPFELGEALDEACRLLRLGIGAVKIVDDEGRTIAGDDLAACCDGSKYLTFDLRAVPLAP
jgi:hypothetical protein